MVQSCEAAYKDRPGYRFADGEQNSGLVDIYQSTTTLLTITSCTHPSTLWYGRVFVVAIWCFQASFACPLLAFDSRAESIPCEGLLLSAGSWLRLSGDTCTNMERSRRAEGLGVVTSLNSQPRCVTGDAGTWKALGMPTRHMLCR
jgi:hypothetical protein